MLTLLLIALLQPVASIPAGDQAAVPASTGNHAAISSSTGGQAAVAVPTGVETATLDALEARMPGASVHYQVTVVRLVDVPEPLPSFHVVLPASPLLPKGRLQVRLERASDLSPAGWAMLVLARYDSVAVVPYALERGESIAPDDLRFAWIETTRFSGEPMTPASLRRHTELVAARGLTADRPLRADDLRPPVAADTGDRVRMTFVRTGFRLEIACDARDRGDVGDIIRLYADESDRMYRARLTGPGTAVWVETL